MSLPEQASVLRRYILAKRKRQGIRSASLEVQGEPSGTLKEDNYAELCQLVKGVPEFTLKLLEAWWCESLGSTWTVNAVEIRGRMHNIPIEQVAVRMTLREAAEFLGYKMTQQQARRLYNEAMSIVLDNLIERQNRGDHEKAVQPAQGAARRRDA